MIEIVHVEARLACPLAVAEQVGVLFPERDLPGGGLQLLRQPFSARRVRVRFPGF
jgi:hypothetical protein